MHSRNFIGRKVFVKIDRPLGSKHPKFETVYPVNYGFVPGVLGGDGEELDAYVLGEAEALTECEGVCVAVLHRLDDDDDKLIVQRSGLAPTETEIRQQVDFQERYFRSVVFFD